MEKIEPEITEENVKLTKMNRSNTMSMKLVKKIQFKVKISLIFSPQFSLEESYVLFTTDLDTKGMLSGLPRY